MRFLFGEPRFVRSVDPNKSDKKAFVIDTDGLKLANVLAQRRIARECAVWIEEKVAIKSVQQAGLLHGKMYHIANGAVSQAILGSSNFTTHGLGLANSNNNIELNLVVDSSRDRDDLKVWFDELWDDEKLVVDVKHEVLDYLAQVYHNHSPQFIYYKTLFHIFEEYLDAAGRVNFDLGKTTLFDTDIWRTLFAFQKDGAKAIINKILKYNGCILADSVGLGKTYTALAVIKYFELRNERVLVLCPKKLRENWTIYRQNDQLNSFVDDRFRFDVLSHTDLSRDGGLSGDINLATVNWGNYDLVVIDESHNFRNNTPGRKDETGTVVRRSRYQRLMDDIIKAGVRTKVLLLSATPVNNDLRDLRNQLYLLTAGADDAFVDAFDITSLKETLRQAQGQFTLWVKKPAEVRTTRDLLNSLGSDFFKLLDELTIARARRHVQKYYQQEMERLGGFPARTQPVARFANIDLSNRFMSYDKLSEEIEGYTLSLFNPSRFVLPRYQEEYARRVGNFTQAQREGFLIGMMKVNFLKRLESSVHAFALTMQRTIDKIEALEHRLHVFQAAQENADIDLEVADLADIEDEELRESLQVGKKLTFRTAHLDVERWLTALQQDKQQLYGLHLQARDVCPARDAKLAELKALIQAKVTQPTHDKDGAPNRKVLIFTAFADTATYLYAHLQRWVQQELGIHIALVVGSGENHTTFTPTGYSHANHFNHILINFSPRSKQRARIAAMPQTGEIDLLIATDCISEGQNLQDCDYLINYDIHWNPVRIIQRFGRIDRIGSRNETVQMVNFWPTPHLDRYISLKYRVEARMALVDIAATSEDDLFKTNELEELIKDDLKYRDHQLLRLQNEVLNLEDLDDAPSLTEFSLDDFRIDLFNYLEANRRLLEEAPLGLYAVAPSPNNDNKVAPGVIYCLRHRTADPQEKRRAASQEINPLQPYYLVYVRNDGEVRLSFAQPKQTLSLLRGLCAGHDAAYEELCRRFDEYTQDGREMSHYTHLLERAVASIVATFRKRMAATLQSGRNAQLPDVGQQVSENSDFELATWVVIGENRGR
ncbi:MAG: helicase-related protein [Caldilinea sp.]|nr:helicase-related protein [Caldilinea sp.]